MADLLVADRAAAELAWAGQEILIRIKTLIGRHLTPEHGPA
jgi:hypothetical protein